MVMLTAEEKNGNQHSSFDFFVEFYVDNNFLKETTSNLVTTLQNHSQVELCANVRRIMNFQINSHTIEGDIKQFAGHLHLSFRFSDLKTINAMNLVT